MGIDEEPTCAECDCLVQVRAGCDWENGVDLCDECLPIALRGEISTLRAKLTETAAELAASTKALAETQQMREKLATWNDELIAQLAEAKADLAQKHTEYLAAVDSGQEYAKAWAEAKARIGELEAQRSTLREAAEKTARFCNNAGWYIPAGILEKALEAVEATKT